MILTLHDFKPTANSMLVVQVSELGGSMNIFGRYLYPLDFVWCLLVFVFCLIT